VSGHSFHLPPLLTVVHAPPPAKQNDGGSGMTSFLLSPSFSGELDFYLQNKEKPRKQSILIFFFFLVCFFTMI
jgi:hypothetical protein